MYIEYEVAVFTNSRWWHVLNPNYNNRHYVGIDKYLWIVVKDVDMIVTNVY